MKERVLDFAEQHDGWWVPGSALITGWFGYWAVRYGIGWCWLPVALGLAMAAICPWGTQARRHRRLAEHRAAIAEIQRQREEGCAEIIGQLDQLQQRIQNLRTEDEP